jgi:quaternary ammonium compound-resistance protein SugE
MHRYEDTSGRHGLRRLVGVGAVGTVVLGIVLLGESVSLARMMGVAIIVAGIVGLQLSTP